MKSGLVVGRDGTPGNRRERRAEARSKAARPYVATGVALVAASAVTVSGMGPVDSGRPMQAEARAQLDHGADIRLAAAASSISNLPQNLLTDIINMPYAALQAFDLFASAQLFGGNWIVTGPSNVWGTDPADAARFVAAAGMLVPIPGLTGFNTEISADNPLGVLGGDGFGQQFWRFMAAEVPVNPYCDAEECVMTTPMSPITGIRVLDNFIWNALIITGVVDFPLFTGWFRVPPSKLANGTFNAETTLIEAPSGPIYALDGFGIPGTVRGPNGENLLPWAGTPINVNPFKPFQNWVDHLLADPYQNSVKLPSLEQFGRALQTFAAGMVAGFDLFTPGSSLCPGFCVNVPPAVDYPAIVEWIGSLWPGNEKIDTWLAAYKAGTSNTPTGSYIARNIELLQASQRFWDFSNPPLDPQFSNVASNPSDLAPFFHNLWTSLGLNPEPLYPVKPTTAAASPQHQAPAAASAVSAADVPSAPATPAVVAPPTDAPAVADVPAVADDPLAEVPAAGGGAVPDVPGAERLPANLLPDAPTGQAETATANDTSGRAGALHRGRPGESRRSAPSVSAPTAGGSGAVSTPNTESGEGR